jgi:hypothetical protein
VSEYQLAIDIAQIVAGGGAAAAALAAFIQSRQTKHQMDHTLRAWVGVDYDKSTISKDGAMLFAAKNYGQLPATELKHWKGFQLQPFTKEQLRQMRKTPFEAEASLLPGAYHTFKLQIPEPDRVIDERLTLHYAFIIEYSYGKNGRGKYELFGTQTPAFGQDEIDYEFVE